MSETLHNPLDAYKRLLKSGEIKADKQQESVIRKLQMLHDNILEEQERRVGIFSFLSSKKQGSLRNGMYIWGGVGRGKTMLMDLFYDHTAVINKKRIHFHAFMQDIHARIHRLRQDESQYLAIHNPVDTAAKHIASEADLLCLDEFQVTDVADAMILGQLFTNLFQLGVVVVITSNRPPKDLYLNGLQRERFLAFIALIEEMIDVVELDSKEDYRLRQLKALKQTYMHPLGKKADEFLQTSYKQLTHQGICTPITLDIQGRELKIRQSCGDVAMFSFAELCEQPLGAADYLTIASEFHTILLSDIPILTPESRNEAKRFVTLIDAFYDHQVKLICTAAAKPEKLYPKGDGAFEFDRTVSRLAEMQSERYFALPHRIAENE
jgi:cell division protein ZapE